MKTHLFKTKQHRKANANKHTETALQEAEQTLPVK